MEHVVREERVPVVDRQGMRRVCVLRHHGSMKCSLSECLDV